MTPISPVLGDEMQPYERVYAENQKEYTPLPVIQSPTGILLSRWHLDDAERARIAAGADIHFFIWTGGQPLQPVRLEVAEHERCLLDTAKFLGLIPSDSPVPQNEVG